MKRELSQDEIDMLMAESARVRGIPIADLTRVPGHAGYCMTPKIIDHIAWMLVTHELYPDGSAVVMWLRYLAARVRQEGQGDGR